MTQAMAGLGLLLAVVFARSPGVLAMSMTVDGARMILPGTVS